MKKISTFLMFLFVLGGLFAQDYPTGLEQASDSAGGFTLDDIKFWVGDGKKRAAIVVDWHKEKTSAMVWGYCWDGEATGFDMIKAIVEADPRLLFLTQETNLGHTVAGIGYGESRKDFILKYDLEGAKSDSRISFGFDDPNIFLGQTSSPADPEQEIAGAIADGLKSGVVYHPFNYAIYGYASYDYDYWNCDNPDVTWRSSWYEGYWSYFNKNDISDDFNYSGIGVSLRELTDGCWDAWGFQDGMGGFEGAEPRKPYKAALPFIAFEEKFMILEDGETVRLSASVYPHNISFGKIIWTTNNPDIATVNSDGVVTNHSVGSVVVTALTENENILPATCEITWTAVPVTGITVTPAKSEMNVGEELQIEAIVLPLNASERSIKAWVSEKPAIASVDVAGTVKALLVGNVKITAITEDGEFEASCEIMVKQGQSIGASPVIQTFVYPTVTTGMVTVGMCGKEKVSVSNGQGHILQSVFPDGNKALIDLGSYPPGIYFIKAGTSFFKIIKK